MPTGFFLSFLFFCSDQKKFIFHIHFKTWPLQSIPIIRSSLLRATKKVSLNPYRIRIFFLVSFLFNWIVHTLLQFLIPSKTITEFRPKWAKSLCPFSNQIGAPPPPPPGWGGTLAHSLHGVGGGRPLGDRDKREEDFPFLISKANMGNISTFPGFVHDFRSPKYCVPDVYFLALPFSYFMKSGDEVA